MTPGPGLFPRPLASAIPWMDRQLHQGWVGGYGGAASHFRAELSMNQEGKGVGMTEQNLQGQAEQARLLDKPPG
jgi:hypothetical protein